MALHTIPLALGRQRPSAPDDFVGRPLITVVNLASDQEWTPESKVLPASNSAPYSALVDTGAERLAVDKAVAEAIGAAIDENCVTIHAMSGTQKASSCLLQVIFPTIGGVYCERAAVLDFHSAGNTFDLVLGRSFLQRCALYVDPPANIYRLDWVGY